MKKTKEDKNRSSSHATASYTSGQLAKKAGVSVRTVRYYDQIGLLHPSQTASNGYRTYTDDDFLILQKITIFKYLGFSLNEIALMIHTRDTLTMESSLDMQIASLEQKINQLQSLKESLITAKAMVKENTLDWQSVQKLSDLRAQEEKLREHYRSANHLSIRIHLHEMFSQNPQGWFTWLLGHIDFRNVNRLLEIGCGDGALWQKCSLDLRHRDIYLSDRSKGMVDFARQRLGEDYSYLVLDAANIPFKPESFDAVVANHMLFYVHSLPDALREIQRVLKTDGVFYASTYGSAHMQEISALAQDYDPAIRLSDQKLSERFGLENGTSILEEYFQDVKLYRYPDTLVIDDPQPLLDYIMSCHGNQSEILSCRLEDFAQFVCERIHKAGKLVITKDAGLFVAKGRQEKKVKKP